MTDSVTVQACTPLSSILKTSLAALVRLCELCLQFHEISGLKFVPVAFPLVSVFLGRMQADWFVSLTLILQTSYECNFGACRYPLVGVSSE